MITGPKGAQTVEVDAPEIVIGRDSRCAVVLDDESVSAEHCSIQSVMSAWKVVDLESDAGTRVNGRHVNQAPLRTGDMLEVGEFRIVFEESVGLPAVATPKAERITGTTKPARGRSTGRPKLAVGQKSRGPKPPPRRRGPPPPPADRDPDADRRRSARESRHRQRQTSQGMLTLGLVVIGVIAVALIGVFVLGGDSTPPNQAAFMRMQTAADNFEWEEVVQIAQSADLNDPDFGPRMKPLLDNAKQQISLASSHQKNTESIPAWNEIRAWRQKNWKENDEFVRRIDAYLAEYGPSGGQGVEQARRERAQVTGDSGGPVPKDAEQAFAKLKNDVAALTTTKLGRYGAAIEKTNEFAKEWGGRSPQLRKQAEDLGVKLRKDANSHMAGRIMRARQKFEEGSPYQARKVLNQAADNIGIPELRERASDALRDILGEAE